MLNPSQAGRIALEDGPSSPSPHRGEGVAAALLGLCLGVAASIGPAEAEKVGVAAAVNPDAFSSLSGSPQSQLNIGKSIFYSERINTTGSGLVQVLLVDGSTFTVGPGSDLVIDRFVYDPKKKTGEVVATFSKGVLRFVGGKISKNEDGVTIKTPDGTLAIRGGMAQGDVKMKIWSFLHGVEMKFTGKNGQTTSVWEHGYTLDLTSGTPKIRPTTAADINSIMTALTKGGGTGTGTGTPGTDGGNPPPKQVLAETLSLQQLIADATATKVDDELTKEEEVAAAPITTEDPVEPDPVVDPVEPDPVKPDPVEPDPVEPDPVEPDPVDPPPPDLVYGYAGGVYEQEGGDVEYDEHAGTLRTMSPDHFALAFDKDSGEFVGAAAALFANGGGGLTALFTAVEIPDEGPNYGPNDLPDLYDALFAGTAGQDAIAVYNDTTQDQPPQLASPATLNPGNSAILAGFEGAGEVLCETCDFLSWGLWTANANFKNDANLDTSVVGIGLWVSGDVINDVVGELPLDGTAYYAGSAVGMVVTVDDLYNNGVPYLAYGGMDMSWDFASRTGRFDVTDFDSTHIEGGLDFGGNLSAPGVVSGVIEPTGKLNQFSGALSVTNYCPPPNLNNLTGSVTGSFVGATKIPDLPGNLPGNPKGVIGNWNISNDVYKASGIFAGANRPGD